MTKAELLKSIAGLPDDEILIVAYWKRDMFPNVPDEDWEDFAEHLDNKMDWSNTHDQMCDMYTIWEQDNA